MFNTNDKTELMNRYAVLIYGLVVYLIFLVTFCYLIYVTANVRISTSMEGIPSAPLWKAIGTNILLITLFGVQHSVMARAWFKDWWKQYVPEAVERSTYVLFTFIVLIILFVFWQPIGGTVWSIENGFFSWVVWGLFALGWVLVLASSFFINHFDLFGLRQVWLYFRGEPYTLLPFRINYMYHFIRHPLYFGFLLAFWSAPVMTCSRLIFALGFTVYVLLGIQWEEKDLLKQFGEKYRLYKDRVPKIIPSISIKKWKMPDYESIIKKEDIN